MNGKVDTTTGRLQGRDSLFKGTEGKLFGTDYREDRCCPYMERAKHKQLT